jgi:hypothetical protein
MKEYKEQIAAVSFKNIKEQMCRIKSILLSSTFEEKKRTNVYEERTCRNYCCHNKHSMQATINSPRSCSIDDRRFDGWIWVQALYSSCSNPFPHYYAKRKS